MKFTGSVSKGKTAPVHNRRACRVDHADPALREANEVLLDDDLSEAYERVFGDARRAYNEAQVAKGHAERQVADYLAKVEADKQLQAIYELVVAVGSMESCPDVGIAKQVYRDWLAMFQERLGDHFHAVQFIIHADEPGACHAHIEFFPVADSKRGLSRQNSMSKALQQAGYKGQNGYNAFMTDLQDMLTEAMARNGIERVAGDKAKQMGGISIGAYKRVKEAQERSERLETVIQQKVTQTNAKLKRAAQERDKALQERDAVVQERDSAQAQAAELAEEAAQARQQLAALEAKTTETAVELAECSETLALYADGLEEAQQRLEAVRQLAVEVDGVRAEVRALGESAESRGAASHGWAERCAEVAGRVRELAARVAAAAHELAALFSRLAALPPVPEMPPELGKLDRKRQQAAAVNAARGVEIVGGEPVMHATMKPTGKKEESVPVTPNSNYRTSRDSLDARRRDGIGGHGHGSRGGRDR